MKWPARKAKNLTRSEKAEFVIEHRFPGVRSEELEDIEAAVERGVTVEEAIGAHLDDEELAPDRREHCTFDLKAALAVLSELRSNPGMLNAAYQEIQEQRRERHLLDREQARFFNRQRAQGDFEYWAKLSSGRLMRQLPYRSVRTPRRSIWKLWKRFQASLALRSLTGGDSNWCNGHR
jgi:hypothetical protein